jgi:hypothetical protein
MLRKIKTPEMTEKKKKRTQIFVGATLVFLLILSTAGYSLFDRNSNNGNGDKVTENGMTFYKIGELWNIQIDEKVLTFSYLPSEVENISVKGVYSLSDYLERSVYFSDLNNEGTMELLTNLQYYILRYQGACVSEEDCESDLPVKTCEENFIIFTESENSSVYKNSSCVYVTGDFKRGADALMYKFLNIV